MSDRFLCVHGHFYQPPRENPWLEAIEVQDSAHPFHDWNQRIAAECYAPNAAARMLDAEGRIERMVSNYSRISFNFGPTLLAWMEEEDPETYAAVLEADRTSAERFDGHGSAMAQAYNHMILPLAGDRDRHTQVHWGIRDFEHRFGRRPEGMWLPETAADRRTLETLAAEGIRFTVLAPHQAARFRRKGEEEWRPTAEAGIDPTRPYEVPLSGGASITVFFYDGPISRAVAFERLLERGESFAHRLLGGLHAEGEGPRLMHIATDGETYGHHHRHGEMALAYALRYIEENDLARLTNYAAYLDAHPPDWQAEIVDDTSWSCAHGVERWRSDCGCSTGGGGDWNQAWRAPLREALDQLRDALAPLWEEAAGTLLRDPWGARDAYIDIILDRSEESRARYVAEHTGRALDEEEEVRLWKLLELQRHAMLMYTSCGWFFDELTRIETVQVIQYAGRTLQLARDVLDTDLEPAFLERLARARSNLPEHGDGRDVYERMVRPTVLDPVKVGAHYAVSSLFEDYPERARIYCYDVDRKEQVDDAAGRFRFLVGRARITSRITREETELSYGVLHMGDHNLNAGVREFHGADEFRALVEETRGPLERADYAELVRLLDKNFGGSTWALSSLFRDEQRRALEAVLEATLTEVESEYRAIYQGTAPLMRSLASLGADQPRVLKLAAQYVLNTSLLRALEEEILDLARVEGLLAEARKQNVSLDARELSLAFRRALERVAARVVAAPEDGKVLQHMREAVALLEEVPFEVDLYGVQRLVYGLRRELPAPLRVDEDRMDDFRALCETVGVRAP